MSCNELFFLVVIKMKLFTKEHDYQMLFCQKAFLKKMS